ncbi:dihydroorotate dehydrogenase [Methanimicrococcus blatticola]|uniref:Dihydroorotate dehydrogenase n=1 Tax=Methanimicrococcus blatticola TaxID=91560 RepID=A0A484F3M2_9EURY|nr:dihydroorotate dehydrogenase [Methanimicrococcus blatticola]MBZ3935741.1 dihydroorotate dehydrogenase [Methanimicrococcus blatticola]MCC2508139.1 dihydroorotate dehydrogenase [Methanimicrococcus blatticola]TDQ68783.1 dihydroorotate oxidase B catalytic subunit [Methanimicrococcus blatticola]
MVYIAAGVPLKNPTILAAGILGTTGASMTRVIQNGAGAVVTKSIGPVPVYGHANPSMITLNADGGKGQTFGYLNAMGLPNPSYGEFTQEIEFAKKNGDAPVIASIFGGDSKDFVAVAEGLMPSKPDAFELNLSCPHAKGYGADIGSQPCHVEEITAAVKNAVDVPVWVKLTPNVANIKDIGLAAQAGGADAVVAINTVRGMVIDIHSGWPVLGNRAGGMSGPAVKPVAVKCVYDLYEALEIPVIGVGGISCYEDMIEMMMAGASAVQIGSAVYESDRIFENIWAGAQQFMKENGYAFDELIGMAHRRK